MLLRREELHGSRSPAPDRRRHQERQPSRRRDGEVRASRPLERRFRPHRRVEHPFPALWSTAPHGLAGEGRYDWGFADATFAGLKRRNIVPIVDLCHFGVPDWIGNFQNRTSRASFRPTRALSPTVFRGSTLHARQPDVRLRHLLRPSTAGETSR